MKYSTRQIVITAVLAAISSILFMIEIPVVLFYKLDLSNVPVMIGTFSMGPYSGITILFIKCLTGITHSGTGMIGELADFFIGLIFVIVCSVFYSKNRTKRSALIGMIISTFLATVAGVIINKFVLIPLFVPENGMKIVTSMAHEIFPFVESEAKFLLFVTAPFNILKGAAITTFTFLIYKRLSAFIHKGI